MYTHFEPINIWIIRYGCACSLRVSRQIRCLPINLRERGSSAFSNLEACVKISSFELIYFCKETALVLTWYLNEQKHIKSHKR